MDSLLPDHLAQALRIAGVGRWHNALASRPHFDDGGVAGLSGPMSPADRTALVQSMLAQPRTGTVYDFDNSLLTRLGGSIDSLLGQFGSNAAALRTSMQTHNADGSPYVAPTAVTTAAPASTTPIAMTQGNSASAPYTPPSNVVALQAPPSEPTHWYDPSAGYARGGSVDHALSLARAIQGRQHFEGGGVANHSDSSYGGGGSDNNNSGGGNDSSNYGGGGNYGGYSGGYGGFGFGGIDTGSGGSYSGSSVNTNSGGGGWSNSSPAGSSTGGYGGFGGYSSSSSVGGSYGGGNGGYGGGFGGGNSSGGIGGAVTGGGSTGGGYGANGVNGGNATTATSAANNVTGGDFSGRSVTNGDMTSSVTPSGLGVMSGAPAVSSSLPSMAMSSSAPTTTSNPFGGLGDSFRGLGGSTASFGTPGLSGPGTDNAAEGVGGYGSFGTGLTGTAGYTQQMAGIPGQHEAANAVASADLGSSLGYASGVPSMVAAGANIGNTSGVSLASNPISSSGFGSDVTGDPSEVAGYHAVTIHPAAHLAGYDAPSQFDSPAKVQAYSISDIAQNFGRYGYAGQFGLPDNYSFQNPSNVAKVVGGNMRSEGGMNADGTMNTSAINGIGATGLSQMYSTNSVPGSYDVNPASSADRISSLVSFLSKQTGLPAEAFDPRISGKEVASQNLDGTFNAQVAQTLGQLAANPAYARALAAATDPGANSVTSNVGAYASNFENPGDAEVARSLPNRVANAMAIARALNQTGDPVSPNVTHYDGSGSFNPGAYSPAAADASTPTSAFSDYTPSEGLQSALADVYGRHLDTATGAAYSTAMPASFGSLDSRADDGGFALNDPSVDKMASAIAYAGEHPGIASFGVPGNPNGTFASLNPTSRNEDMGFSGDAPPSTAQSLYASSKKSADDSFAQKAATMAINGAVGMVPGLGLVNGVSSLFGGPNVGSFVVHNAHPGDAPQAAGNANGANAASALGAHLSQIAPPVTNAQSFAIQNAIATGKAGPQTMALSAAMLSGNEAAARKAIADLLDVATAA